MPDLFLPRAKILTRIVFSALILVAGLYVILSGQYSPVDVAWASGIVGVVIGYWLR